MIGDSCWRNDVTLRVVTSWVVERLSNPGGGKALRYNGPRRPQEAPGGPRSGDSVGRPFLHPCPRSSLYGAYSGLSGEGGPKP